MASPEWDLKWGGSSPLILYIIPGLACILMAMSFQSKSIRGLQILTGAAPLAILAYYIAKINGEMGAMGNSIFEILGLGAYLTIGAAMGLLLVGFTKVGKRSTI